VRRSTALGSVLATQTSRGVDRGRYAASSIAIPAVCRAESARAAYLAFGLRAAQSDREALKWLPDEIQRRAAHFGRRPASVMNGLRFVRMAAAENDRWCSGLNKCPPSRRDFQSSGIWSQPLFVWSVIDWGRDPKRRVVWRWWRRAGAPPHAGCRAATISAPLCEKCGEGQRCGRELSKQGRIGDSPSLLTNFTQSPSRPRAASYSEINYATRPGCARGK
jgi:hypothetical protein